MQNRCSQPENRVRDLRSVGVMKVQKLRYSILAADLCWMVGAMILSYVARYEGIWQEPLSSSLSKLGPFLLGALVFWAGISFWLPLDGFHGGWQFTAISSQLFLAASGLMALLFAGAYLGRLYTSRLILGYFGTLLFLGLLGIRIAARAFLASRYRAGDVRKAVIVGTGPIASEIADKIESHPEMLLDIAGYLCPAENAPSLSAGETNGQTISVGSVGIVELLRSRAIDEVIVAMPKSRQPELLDLVNQCLTKGISVSLIPQPYELYVSRPKLIDMDGLPLLKLESVPGLRALPLWKRSFDLVVTICLLPIALPAILAAAAWLKLTKRKGFCSETRCGQGGKPFLMYRLNSDRHGVGLPFHEFAMQQTSFTELPQLFNVLRGDMSLVGPRPEGPDRVQQYSEWHRQRLSVKPGITGLAQVHGIREQNSSEDKTRYDLQYILHLSPFLDVSLLLQTFWTLSGRFFCAKQLRTNRPDVVALEVPLQTAVRENLGRAHSSQSGAN